MRVLLVSHYFPPHMGGIENVVAGEARHLAKAGHDVVVLTTSPGARAGTEVSDDGYRVVRLPTWNGVERATGVPFPLVAPWSFARVARLVRAADVVHVHDLLYVTTWLAAVAARLLRRPYVLTQHVGLVAHPSRVVEGVQKLVHATLGRAVVTGAGAVVHLNGAVAEFLRRVGARPEQLRFVVNGTDTDLFHPADPAAKAALRAEFGLPRDGVLALFAGRFVPKKGFDVVVGAAGEGYTLVLAGGEPPQPWTAPAGVVVAGRMPPERLADLYRACDVFVLPSVAEGFPLTVQEAMATGLPVVITDDPGYAPYGLDRELVGLVRPTSEQVRAALLRIAGDAELRARMGAYSADLAARRFSWAEHVRTLEAVYTEVSA
ncbi:Glycosyltransferase involved in cell wall bisynthesis [Pseudonocardia thermophila]|uniref:Glycosyltransferase involved in cell wall bisynthesis n=1 Tax=Pseudonocardia thermophila TaxID=1848 RepID=A0A1M6YUE3_PSETH|nr:glycosyltransferase family 4 protein [Pseudonocardia thermophila]SHL21750.1 Glycosyltransferase involved in cell wall bisynthesis [Pseudonocardia thermophila]